MGPLRCRFVVLAKACHTLAGLSGARDRDRDHPRFGADAGREKGARLAADLIFKVAIIALFTFSAVLASMLWLRV
ncbi:hypothetical protein [Bradyrhizobium stylosanthis]|uniref:hypothetical protein n=1 Tax=Bradyrhizobium stylosanthis TaxID=1803665 RepID=UPI0007C42C4A|nr:hypothetical protein [Bradyrhizobium stylosanthis]